jgi:NTP pyrophosphatase (non-canonical NTP hydrolase)
MSRQHSMHEHATLGELQKRVDAWISQFEAGYWPPLSMLARLTEEVGELAREINHSYGHKPKKASEPEGDIALEVADIIFVLVCLCNSLGIDLGQAFERVMQKYDQRDRGRWTPIAQRRLPPQRRGRTSLRKGKTNRNNSKAAPRQKTSRPAARPSRRKSTTPRNTPARRRSRSR